MAVRRKILPSLLSNYFPFVLTLECYLDAAVDVDASRSRPLRYDDDIEEYTQLLTSSYVGSMVSPGANQATRMRVFSPMANMKAVTEQAQLLLKRAKQDHVLTTGYSLDKGGELKLDQVNTTAAALGNKEWSILLQRTGVDVMLHLLTQTSIFISLPNECLCQMTGPPLIHIRLPVQFPDAGVPQKNAEKRKANSELEERPKKCAKLAKHDSLARKDSGRDMQTKTIEKTPVGVMFARSRLFYGRPTIIPQSKRQEIICGFQPNHVLNRFIPCYPKGGLAKLDYDLKEQLQYARHLSKYVFPRQYDLSSPFEYLGSSMALPNFSDREDMIKNKGNCKTPKRLKEVLGLLEKLIWRHGKCKYHILRNQACPTKIKDEGNLDKNVILEMLAGETSQLRTQASALGNSSVDSEGNTILPAGLTQAHEETKYRPRIVDYACPYVEVYRYVVLVTKTVVPQELWGSERNFKVIRQNIKEFVTGRRFESVSLHRVLQGFSTSDCEWLYPPGNGSKQMRVSVSDAKKRRELLEDFLFWFFDSFVIALIKTAFYATESASYRNRVLYFRQDDWKRLCSPLIGKLTTDTFHKISSDEVKAIVAARKFGFSFVRLLPKDNGVRPIANLRRKSHSLVDKGFASEKSINQVLESAFAILTYERQANPHLVGSSVVGRNDVYAKLKPFKLRLLRENQNKLPKMYFVKVDVRACFDTIDQSKLLEILVEILSHDVYLKQQYGSISFGNGRVQRKYVKKAIPDGDGLKFLDNAVRLAASLHHTIFVDQVKSLKLESKEVIKLLTQHITDNIVKIGEDYYRQVVGIPQGSVLSSILCAFFYGDMEKQDAFKPFTDDPRSVMLRLMDDYLFITCDVDRAKEFLGLMNKGHPEYGCFISKDKTRTNFDYDSQIMNVIETNDFPWCGYSIDTGDLSIAGDYTRYYGTHLRDTLTVAKERRPGVAFTNKMLLLAKAKSHAIFSDAGLNSERVIYLNVYQNFLLCAMKMHGYIREWRMNITRNGQLIQATIHQLIAYCFASMKSLGRTQVAQENTYKWIVNKADIFFLGRDAFQRILSRKPRHYAVVLHRLRQDLSKFGNARRARRFKPVIADAVKMLDHISY